MNKHAAEFFGTFWFVLGEGVRVVLTAARRFSWGAPTGRAQFAVLAQNRFGIAAGLVI